MSEGDRAGGGGGSPGKQGSSIVKITECQQALSVPLKLQKLTFLEKRGSIVGRKTHSDCCRLVAAVQMKLHMFPVNTAAPQDLVLLPFLVAAMSNQAIWVWADATSVEMPGFTRIYLLENGW